MFISSRDFILLVAYLDNPTTKSIREAVEANVHLELNERVKKYHLIKAQQLILQNTSHQEPTRKDKISRKRAKPFDSLYQQHKRIFYKPIETEFHRYVFDYTCFELFKIRNLSEHVKQSKPLLNHLFKNCTNLLFYHEYINQLISKFVGEYNQTKRIVLGGGKQRVNYKLLDYICMVYREIKAIGNVDVVVGNSLIELEILCQLSEYGNDSFCKGNGFMLDEINATKYSF